MPAVARVGVDIINTGHPCDATAGIAGQLQNQVFIEGSPAAVKGGPIQTHNILVGGICVPHGASINAGSSKVSIAGIPIARVGDSADQGAVATGSSKVSAGG